MKKCNPLAIKNRSCISMLRVHIHVSQASLSPTRTLSQTPRNEDSSSFGLPRVQAGRWSPKSLNTNVSGLKTLTGPSYTTYAAAPFSPYLRQQHYRHLYSPLLSPPHQSPCRLSPTLSRALSHAPKSHRETRSMYPINVGNNLGISCPPPPRPAPPNRIAACRPNALTNPSHDVRSSLFCIQRCGQRCWLGVREWGKGRCMRGGGYERRASVDCAAGDDEKGLSGWAFA